MPRDDVLAAFGGMPAPGQRIWRIGPGALDDYTTWAAFAAAETPQGGDTISFATDQVIPVADAQIALKWSGEPGNPIRITTHGGGAKPQFWGSEQVTSWTKTGGRTYVYQASISGQDMDLIHTTIDGALNYHLWQVSEAAGPAYLTAAADVATVDATQGSCYYDAAADIFYAHPWGNGNPASDGYTYFVPKLFSVFCGTDGAANYEYWDIEGLSIQYTGRYAFASFDPTLSYTCHHMTISDCVVNVSRHDGVAIVGIGQFIDGCYIYNIKANGAIVAQATGPDDGFSLDVTDCHYVDTNGHVAPNQFANGFIHFHSEGHDITVTNCSCSGACQAPLWSADSGTTKNCTVNGLAVSGKPGRFIRFNHPTENVVITGYVASQTCQLSPALDFDVSVNCELHNSFFPGSDATAGTCYGMRLETLTGMICSYTVFKGFTYAAIYQNAASGAGNKFFNCIIHGNYYGYYTNNATTNKPILTNNIFYGNTAGGMRIANGAAGFPASTFNCFYSNLTDFVVAATARDLAYVQAAGGEANSQHADPAFVNAGGSFALPTDFQVSAGSPVIGAGTPIAGLTHDFFGTLIADADHPNQGFHEVAA
jgi:hypothetical protein